MLIVVGLFYGPEATPGRIDGVSSGALAAYVFAAAMLVIANHHDGLTLVVFAVLVAATAAIAWRAEAATAAVPVAGGLAALVLAHWAVDVRIEIAGPHLALGAAFAALFTAGGFPRPGAIRTTDRPDAVGGNQPARADRHPDRALLPDRRG